MVHVRLERDWTDVTNGTRHEAGQFVEVDAVTLAHLEGQGTVRDMAKPMAGETAVAGETAMAVAGVAVAGGSESGLVEPGSGRTWTGRGDGALRRPTL